MRFFTMAPFVLLAACGGTQTSQTNNAQGNAASTVTMPAAPASKEAALAIMHERHEAMEGMGKASKAIKRGLDGKPIDLGAIRQAAPRILNTVGKIPAWFPPGTGADVAKTGAKPAIWQNYADFAAKAHDFDAASKPFAAAMHGVDIEALRSSFANLQKTCKACHDKYRSGMHH